MPLKFNKIQVEILPSRLKKKVLLTLIRLVKSRKDFGYYHTSGD